MDRKNLKHAALMAACDYDNPFDEPAYDKNFYDGFIAGAEWLLAQPLAERLTDEESQEIALIFKLAEEEQRSTSPVDCIKGRVEAEVLSCIFGEGLFRKDTEQ